ncbi:hypothetical protein QTP88_007413 [Uroleucon formosanum]
MRLVKKKKTIRYRGETTMRSACFSGPAEKGTERKKEKERKKPNKRRKKTQHTHTHIFACASSSSAGVVVSLLRTTENSSPRPMRRGRCSVEQLMMPFNRCWHRRHHPVRGGGASVVAGDGDGGDFGGAVSRVVNNCDLKLTGYPVLGPTDMHIK